MAVMYGQSSSCKTLKRLYVRGGNVMVSRDDSLCLDGV